MTRNSNILGKILTFILLIAILGTLGTALWLVYQPKTGEKFTEFYILSYPNKLVQGKPANAILGVENRERDTATYKVNVVIEGKIIQEIDVISLGDGEKWQQEIALVYDGSGLNKKLEFLLYKVPVTQPYRELYLWVDVEAAPNERASPN